MVSFVCDTCQETLKKAKLDMHAQRCRYAQFSCIDCSVSFIGTTYRAHIKCISEDEKYQGALYKKPNKKQQASAITPSNPNLAFKPANEKSLIEQINAKKASASPDLKKQKEFNVLKSLRKSIKNQLNNEAASSPMLLLNLKRAAVNDILEHPGNVMSRKQVKRVFDESVSIQDIIRKT